MDIHERIVEEQSEGMTSWHECAFCWSFCFQYYGFKKLKSENSRGWATGTQTPVVALEMSYRLKL